MRFKTTVTVRVDEGDDMRTKVESEGSHSSGVIYHDGVVDEGAAVKSEDDPPIPSWTFHGGSFSRVSQVPENPYIIEPARSNIDCSACHDNIGSHELRFGGYVENFDRYVYRHLSCMTNLQRGNMRRAGYDQPDHIPGFSNLNEHQKVQFKYAFVGETEEDIRWREEGFPAAVHELKYMSKTELKEQCALFHLKVGGNQPDLLQRLVDHYNPLREEIEAALEAAKLEHAAKRARQATNATKTRTKAKKSAAAAAVVVATDAESESEREAVPASEPVVRVKVSPRSAAAARKRRKLREERYLADLGRDEKAEEKEEEVIISAAEKAISSSIAALKDSAAENDAGTRRSGRKRTRTVRYVNYD